MIIKYIFSDKTTAEVEVDENLGNVIEELEKQAAKIDRKETRRHIYMSQLEEKGYYIADDNDPLEDILEAELHNRLMAAIKQLKPQQRELLRRVFVNRETQEEISRTEGVSQQAISSRLQTIYNFLKKFLE